MVEVDVFHIQYHRILPTPKSYIPHITMDNSSDDGPWLYSPFASLGLERSGNEPWVEPLVAESDITLPVTPLAVWVIRKIGMSTLISNTKEKLDGNTKSAVSLSIAKGKGWQSVAEISSHIGPTVERVISDVLEDAVIAQRVAKVVAALLAPRFLDK